jgi:hypothetical protein
MSNIELLADSRAEAINGGLKKLTITKPKFAVQTIGTIVDGASSVSGNTFNQTNNSTIS